jgi:hypothetical protein
MVVGRAVWLSGESPINKAAELIAGRVQLPHPSGGYVHPDTDPYHMWHRPPLTAANDNHKMPRVIGLAGLAESGKSTAAEHLISTYGYKRLKFADPLKNMCRAIGMTEDMIEGALKETPVDWLCGRTPRYFMQRLGTDFARDLVGPDFWVGLWRRAANDILAAGGRVLSDDVRFDNEADTIRSLGGLVYKIDRPGQSGAGNHSSEEGCDVDVVIHNNGTIHDLYDRLDETIHE